MGQLIVIEGLDGSGKATLTRQLIANWRETGRSVGTLTFPRYGASVHADLVRDALYGRLGDLTESVYGTALLFALDRRGAAQQLREMLGGYDVVLLDRYISSNAAYGAARLGGPGEPTDFPEWVHELEVTRFGIPVPDHQLLLATPIEVAASRARSRADEDAARTLDTFESDAALQRRTGEMYRQLAASNYLSLWTVLEPGPDGSVQVPEHVLTT